ncbi:MAG: ABC transporter ATP-binding protein, partial [Sphingobacteriaceae bacterium]
GIIGRNGAGKSTLLKILSKVTAPTTGKIKVNGRIASLLEVGTGFHPELTGRENIFLNGAILGMTKTEIRSKFDEIVDFSGVERYIDTPVKRYSSGMYVRLAFAVAAFLEPEILIVDEVLAVGDAEFQRKCLGRMKDVSVNDGRTILFVSHQLNAVSSLCNRVMMLDKGRVASVGGTASIIREYVSHYATNKPEWKNENGSYRNLFFIPNEFYTLKDNGARDNSPFQEHKEISIIINGEIVTASPALCIGICLFDGEGNVLMWSYQTDVEEEKWPKLGTGALSMKITIPGNILNEGDYRVDLMVSLHKQEWILQPDINSPSISFSIEGGISKSPYWQERRQGLLAMKLDYKLLNS